MNWSCLTPRVPEKATESTDSCFLDLSSCERLESRQMLAGNVNVVLTGNNVLRITGDGQDNQVYVSLLSNGPTHELIVEGQDGTTINRENAAASIALNDVQRAARFEGRLTVNLRGGNDRFEFDATDLLIEGTLRVNSGAGDDLVAIRGGNVLGGPTAPATGPASRIITGAGDDIILAAFRAFEGPRLQISAGGGSDYVSVGAQTPPPGNTHTPVPHGADVRLGSGDDTLILRHHDVLDLLVLAGGGNDVVAAQNVAAGAQLKTDLDIRLGGGDDAFYVDEDSELRNGRIAGGGGTDTLKFDPSAFVEPVPTQFENDNMETTDATILAGLTSIRFRFRYLAMGGTLALLE